ncbi:unnamed protein product [Meloidogyne enterolobii]|uniref:Uncharacterized protein n=1 Tax=Meloidogyne enterolobii TaxID=390850 RepID=A0ACB1A1U3_MELEN
MFFCSFWLFWLSISSSLANPEKQGYDKDSIVVGYGNHFVQLENKTVILNDKSLIADNINDVLDSQVEKHIDMDKPYSACISDLNEEYIILEYEQKWVEWKGCSVDLITESDHIEFTVLLLLKDCIKHEYCQIANREGGTVLPFAYGLGCEQFVRIRNNKGPLYGEGSTCPNRDQCKKSAGYDPKTDLKKPDCMPWTPLEFEWRCVTPHDSHSSLLASIFPVGASEMAAGVKGKFNNQSTAVKVSVRINKDKSIDIGNLAMFLDDKWVLTEKEKMLEQVHTSFACVNSILEPEMWEIVNATREEFENKKLLTFYFLPMLVPRHRSVGIMKGHNVGTECDNVKIVFSRKEYQMLIIGAPSNRTVNQTDEKPFYKGLLHPLPIRDSQTTVQNNDVLTSSKPSKGKFKREISGKGIAVPRYRRAITLFRIVESGTPWYGSMRLGEPNRTIPGRPGFDHSEQSYSSAVPWPAPGISSKNSKKFFVIVDKRETTETTTQETTTTKIEEIVETSKKEEIVETTKEEISSYSTKDPSVDFNQTTSIPSISTTNGTAIEIVGNISTDNFTISSPPTPTVISSSKETTKEGFPFKYLIIGGIVGVVVL